MLKKADTGPSWKSYLSHLFATSLLCLLPWCDMLHSQVASTAQAPGELPFPQLKATFYVEVNWQIACLILIQKAPRLENCSESGCFNLSLAGRWGNGLTRRQGGHQLLGELK